jgi:hypothetical protein
MAYWTWIALFALAGCLTTGQDHAGFAFGDATSPVGEGGESTGETTLLTTGIEPTTTASEPTASSSSAGSEAGDSESSGVEPPDHVCGNGKVEGPETCDGGIPAATSCASEGMTAGTLACDESTCTLDLSGCWLCGDGIAEGDESCDGDDLDGATCESLGLPAGTLACSDCTFDTTECEAAAFLEDWESGAMSGGWTLGGDGNWVLAGGTPIAGSWSARSGNIGANDESSIAIDLTFPSAGTISFTHRESTEPTFDELRFLIDGAEQGAWSGSNAATSASYPVAAGLHTFEWRYAKDFSINAGVDAVWIDDIVADGGSPL